MWNLGEKLLTDQIKAFESTFFEVTKPIFLHDKPLVYISVEEIGNKSFILSYKIKVEEKLVTTGKSVMVAYDSVISKSVLIPKKMREALLKNK